MISVSEAKRIILDNTTLNQPTLVLLKDAAGLVLAEDIFSPLDIPPFHQASMDGYALSFEGWKSNNRLKIQGIIQAGPNKDALLSPKNAVRIFTGAVVPAGADTVVMQEKARIHSSTQAEDELIIEDKNLVQGMYVRPAGSEIKSGELALAKNSLLTPAAIGFLIGIGITEVLVYPKPRISIIVTGNELQDPGKPLQPGQVYESNSYSLKAALDQFYLSNYIKIYNAKDDLTILTEILKKAIEKSDVVFLAGGVSVGDFDFVPQAIEKNGVTKIFHKIKQKPGKPFFFGKKQNKYVFGLPGNPSSVLTCFYEYVLPALGIMINKYLALQNIDVVLANDFIKPAGLTHFLKGYYDGISVKILNAQESFRLSSFAKANCLVVINEEVTQINKGEMVKIHLIPNN